LRLVVASITICRELLSVKIRVVALERELKISLYVVGTRFIRFVLSRRVYCLGHNFVVSAPKLRVAHFITLRKGNKGVYSSPRMMARTCL